MIFARHRTLLALLTALGGRVGGTDFQKLLLLYCTEEEETPTYDFVPYRFGGFSFTSYADKRRLIDEGLLVDDEQNWILSDVGIVKGEKLVPETPKVVNFAKRTKRLRGRQLIADVYRKYSYYATRSEILDTLRLDAASLDRIEAARPNVRGCGLFTIGYEGLTLEKYLNTLIRSGVTVLCDVRRNPLSRKYGFSKRTLHHACAGIGIRYEHLPDLGIPSEQRRNLNSKTDYDVLFATYRQKDLPSKSVPLSTISSWLSVDEAVALTCFEHEPQLCHRHCVAEAIENQMRPKISVTHL